MLALGLATALGGADEEASDVEPGDGEPGGEASPAPVQSPTPDAAPTDPSDRAALWAALDESGLAQGSVGEAAEAVVVLTGPHFLNPADILPDEPSAARDEACLGLVASLAESGLATVVSGPDQAPTDLVKRLAEDPDLARRVSRVTAPLPAAEAIVDLWAAAAALHDVHGAYGVVDGETTLPERRPAPAEADDPEPDPEPDFEPAAHGGESAAPSQRKKEQTWVA
jgi:hypothetical protein